ncbi:cuticle protein 18.7-like [Ctenocephalides felis]|uniref:cuticle protein 18.7-like n=1 Tax=Ctenocephalides felis TaxID=7515 RepID=UPI000E6E20E2|nr:cuticle protein 18.7-like [Ctenocephalides felis]
MIYCRFHVAGTNLPQAPQQHGGYHTGAALVHSGGHGLYHGPHAAIGHDGHPIETPEVQAAKHAHFKAHAEAAAAAHYGPHQYQAYAPHYAGAGFGGHYQHAVALSAHGTPVETPEVQAAKHAHLQAHAEAAAQHSYGGHGAWRRKRDLYGAGHGGYGGALGFQSHVVHTGGYGGGHGGYYHGPQAVIGPHGQPLETPEVVAAKHAHFAAHAEVKANLHAASAGHAYGGGGFGGAYHGGYLAAGAGGHYGGYHGGAVIGPHGTPLETPEVVAAKHAHFAAHAEAKARNYQAAIADAHSGGHDGGYYAYGGHGHGGW